MWKRFITAVWLLTLLAWAPGGLAQTDEMPTIAILQFGPYISFSNTTDAIFGVLLGTEAITIDEFSALRAGNDVEGEHIRVPERCRFRFRQSDIDCGTGAG